MHGYPALQIASRWTSISFGIRTSVVSISIVLFKKKVASVGMGFG
jgi:hypothetical protein